MFGVGKRFLVCSWYVVDLFVCLYELCDGVECCAECGRVLCSNCYGYGVVDLCVCGGGSFVIDLFCG